MSDLETLLLEFWTADAAIWRAHMRSQESNFGQIMTRKAATSPSRMVVWYANKANRTPEEPSAGIVKAAAKINATTIKELASELLKAVHYRKDDGREIGFDHGDIHAMVLKQFPTVTRLGAHFGKPTRFPIKELHAIASALNKGGAVMPFRPRKRRVVAAGIRNDVRGKMATAESADSFVTCRCVVCERPFTPKQPIHRPPMYCSRSCKGWAYRNRERERDQIASAAIR